MPGSRRASPADPPRCRERGGVYGAAMTAPEFHLYLPQMRLSMDVMVEKARAA